MNSEVNSATLIPQIQPNAIEPIGRHLSVQMNNYPKQKATKDPFKASQSSDRYKKTNKQARTVGKKSLV